MLVFSNLFTICCYAVFEITGQRCTTKGFTRGLERNRTSFLFIYERQINIIRNIGGIIHSLILRNSHSDNIRQIFE